MIRHYNDLTPEEVKVQELFFPYATEKTRKMIARKGRFAHYTTAETATSILKNRQIWMRNAAVMNDFSEVQYGLECLSYAWKDNENGKKFQETMNSIHPGICEEMAARFDSWQPDFKSHTYLTCMSEHRDEEDANGRLSMWRAYGGRSGVALILNLDPFTVITDELAAYSSPVAYETKESFAKRLGEIAERLSFDTDIF
jgi:hypothetical protein